MYRIRIIIADDHRIVRDGLRALLGNGIEIVAEAADGREAVRLVRKHKPDIALMDISMPGLNGIDAVRKICAETPSCKVICLSMHRSGEFVTSMLGAGAVGYLHKDTAFEELSKAIDTVAGGGVYLGEGVASRLVNDYQRLHEKTIDETRGLTLREREVLQLIAEGHKTRDIAEFLSISVKTVESHRSQLMKKLEVDGIAKLTRYAIVNGIVSLE